MRFTIILFLVFISCSKKSKEEINISQEELSIELDEISYENYEIYLLENLDDNRGYCIDIKGSKSNANPENGLQAHTCYSYQGEISVDQKFDQSRIQENEFYMPFFDVCMEVENPESSSMIQLKTCDKNENQKFSLNTNGKISLNSDPNLCLTVSENSREGGGGNPIHKIRNLSLENCTNNISSLQTWGLRKIQ